MLVITITMFTVHATEDKSNICAIGDYDYNLETTESGYIFHFEDKTKDAFIAYVDVNYSTIIPHPTDPQGSPIPSTKETLRLKRVSRAKFGAEIPNEVLMHSLYENTLNGTEAVPSNLLDQVVTNNQVQLRFTFSFWLVSSDGTEDVVCESPFFIV